MTEAVVDASATCVLPPELDRRYPVAVRGKGVWLEDAAGKRYLDALSGGSMAATLGYGREDLLAAAREQAGRLSFAHNELLTNPAQRLAGELVEVAPEASRACISSPVGRRRTRLRFGWRAATRTGLRAAGYDLCHWDNGTPDPGS